MGRILSCPALILYSWSIQIQKLKSTLSIFYLINILSERASISTAAHLHRSCADAAAPADIGALLPGGACAIERAAPDGFTHASNFFDGS